MPDCRLPLTDDASPARCHVPSHMLLVVLSNFPWLPVPPAQLPAIAPVHAPVPRLPVLAGSRLICYMSSEQWHDDLPLVAPREPRWSRERQQAELQARNA